MQFIRQRARRPVAWLLEQRLGVLGATAAGSARCAASKAAVLAVLGSLEYVEALASGRLKSKQPVRSPAIARFHGLTLDTVMPKRFSRNIAIDVCENTCELTQPPASTAR